MRKLAGVTAFSLAVLAGSVQAVSLGDIQLHSALNQALDAEIGLVKMRPGEARGMSVNLAPLDAFVRAGIDRSSALEQLEFSIRKRSNGETYVHIASDRPITEPFLNFLVELDWPQGSVLREYTVLLDPPVFLSDRAQAAPVTRQPSVPLDTSGEQVPYIPQPIERSASTQTEGGELNLDALIAENARSTQNTQFEADAPRGRAAVNSLIEGSRAGLDPLPVVPGQNQPLFYLNGKPVYQPLDSLNAGAPPVLVANNDVVENLPNQNTTVSDTGGGSVYTVNSSQTLWSIAKEVKPDGVSIQQTLMAIWRSNQDAFVNGNMNVMRRGAILRIPDAATIRRLNSSEAAQIVQRESSTWRQLQNNAQSQPAVPARSGSSGRGSASDSVQSKEPEQGLKIVAVDQSAQTGDGTVSVKTEVNQGDSAQVATLKRELNLAREELASAKLKGDELSERVQDLEGITSELRRLLEVRDGELANLQRQVGQAESSKDTDNLPTLDSGSNTLETVGEGIESMAESAGEGIENAVDSTVRGTQNLIDGLDPNAEDSTSTSGVSDTMPLDNNEPGTTDPFDPFAPQESEKPWWEEWLANPLFLPIVGGSILLLLLLLFLLGRRGKAEEQDERDVFSTLDQSAFNDLDETNDDTRANAAGLGALDNTQTQYTDDDFEATVVASEREDRTDDYTQVMDDYTHAMDDADDSANATQIAAGVLEDEDRLDLSSEFEMVPGDADDIQDDTVSEADVYISYGLLDRAEELLQDAIKREPDNSSYRVKLLETYQAKLDKQKFAATAQAYHDDFQGTDSPDWDNVEQWGRSLVPEYTLFGGSQAISSLASAPASSEHLADDDELEATQILDASQIAGDDDMLMDTSINDLTEDLSNLNDKSDDKAPRSTSSKLATAMAAAGGIAAAGAAAAFSGDDDEQTRATQSEPQLEDTWADLNLTMAEDDSPLDADLEATLAGLEKELNLEDEINDSTSAIDNLGDDTADLLASLRKDEAEFNDDLKLANEANSDAETLGFDDSFLADFKDDEPANSPAAARANEDFTDDTFDFTPTEVPQVEDRIEGSEDSLELLLNDDKPVPSEDDFTADFNALAAPAPEEEGFLDTVKDGLIDAKDTVSDGVSNAAHAVSDTVGDATQAVSDKVGDATQAVSDKFGDAKQAVSEGVDNMLDSTSAFVDDSKQAVSEFVSGEPEPEDSFDFTQVLQEVQDSGEAKVDEVVQDTEAGLDELDNALFGDTTTALDSADDDMQNSLEDLERTLAEIETQVTDESSTTDATVVLADTTNDLERDLSDDLGTIELEFEQSLLDPAVASEKMSQTSETLDATQIADDALSLESTIDAGDEIETMLDLAQAYVEMGDNDSAASALNEIISNGSNQQRAKAQELLAQIS